jgi:hypothetical protein
MTLTRHGVRMGDTVRLITGETIVVSHVSEWYEDREGRHEGPWVSAKGAPLVRRRFDEIVEVVGRNPNICVLCGEGVTSKNPAEYPYCKGCHYTGAAAEDMRSIQIAGLKIMSGADNVSIWHTGGGCFQMTFQWNDTPHYTWAATDGEACLPDKDGRPIQGGWGWVGRYFYNPDDDQQTDDHLDYEGMTVLEPPVSPWGDTSDRYWDEYPTHCLSDQQIAEAVRDDHDRLKEGEMDYLYIRAWGRMMGSNLSYIADQVSEARKEKAPEDALYKSSETGRWETMSNFAGTADTRRQIEATVASMGGQAA